MYSFKHQYIHNLSVSEYAQSTRGGKFRVRNSRRQRVYTKIEGEKKHTKDKDREWIAKKEASCTIIQTN